jgi:hypothetical protein
MKPPQCAKCDARRRREGNHWEVGLRCDICDGRRFDFLLRPCRHCAAGVSDEQ